MLEWLQWVLLKPSTFENEIVSPLRRAKNKSAACSRAGPCVDCLEGQRSRSQVKPEGLGLQSMNNWEK